MSVDRIQTSKLLATLLCPEFKVTSSGIYRPNAWTDFADKRIFRDPKLLSGLDMESYQNWLDWTYEVLALDAVSDPVKCYAKDIDDIAQDVCVALWLVPFNQKGFPIDFNSSPDPRFAMIDDSKGRFERELVRGRFGDDVLLERFYESGTSDLSSVHMAYMTDEGLVFRIDDPDQWSYQYDQMRNQFLIKSNKVSARDLADSEKPLFREVFDGGWAQSIYSGEIALFKND